MSRLNHHKLKVSVIGLAVVVFFGVIAPTVFLIWRSLTPTVAIQKLELGTFVSATASSGGTSVQTTIGTVTVDGPISAPTGQKLAIERFGKIDGQQLCVDGDVQSCRPLASPWLGALEPTPQAATAFDFQRYGLSADDLEGWLVIGVVLSFLAILVCVEVGLNRDMSTDDTPSSSLNHNPVCFAVGIAAARHFADELDNVDLAACLEDPLEDTSALREALRNATDDDQKAILVRARAIVDHDPIDGEEAITDAQLKVELDYWIAEARHGENEGSTSDTQTSA